MRNENINYKRAKCLLQENWEAEKANQQLSRERISDCIKTIGLPKKT